MLDLRDMLTLVRASWSVLCKDKELLVLPLVAGALAVVTIVALTYPAVRLLFIAGETTGVAGKLNYGSAVVVGLLGCMLVGFIGKFFNAALIHAVNERMDGGDPNLISALAGAARRIGRIVAWPLAAAPVTSIMSQRPDRAVFKHLVEVADGTVWAVITLLVLPVVVVEGLSPVEAVKRSANLTNNSWGIGLVSHIAIRSFDIKIFGWLFVLVVLSGLINTTLLFGTIPLAFVLLVICTPKSVLVLLEWGGVIQEKVGYAEEVFVRVTDEGSAARTRRPVGCVVSSRVWYQ